MKQTKVEQGIDRKLCRQFYKNMKKYFIKIIMYFTLINTNINWLFIQILMKLCNLSLSLDSNPYQ